MGILGIGPASPLLYVSNGRQISHLPKGVCVCVCDGSCNTLEQTEDCLFLEQEIGIDLAETRRPYSKRVLYCSDLMVPNYEHIAC